ncbi:MAG: PLD nuclease N-terminal domain-containing protein [Rhodoglobus sp.]
MARLLLILVFVAVAVDVFAIVDVVLTDPRRVRALNKALWVLIVLALPILGAVLWFTIGKDRNASGGERRTIAPDDDPSFLKNLRRDEEQDERIRRLEQELADLDDDQPKE